MECAKFTSSWQNNQKNGRHVNDEQAARRSQETTYYLRGFLYLTYVSDKCTITFKPVRTTSYPEVNC